MIEITVIQLILSQITIVTKMIFIKLQIFASAVCLKYQNRAKIAQITVSLPKRLSSTVILYASPLSP